MSPRLNYFEKSPELTKKVFELSGAVKKSSLSRNTLLDLVNIRASQLNGCAFCLDITPRKLCATEGKIGIGAAHLRGYDERF
jgi:alkylhydroperoxidase family enzyme